MASANVFASLLAQPVKSVQEYDDERAAREANRMALQDKRRASQLADQQFQQQASDRNALQRLAQESGGDQNKLVQALRGSGSAGLMSQADAIEKSLLDRRKTESDVGKVNAETLSKHLDAMKFLSTGVMANPSPQNAALAIDAFERMTGRQMPEERQKLAQLQTPEQVKQWAAGHALQAEQLLPKLQSINAGGSMVQQAVNPMTGVAMETGRTEITQSADNAATQATARANNAATVGASLANAAAVRDAAKEQAGATRAAANAQRDQATEMKLADDYRAQSKEFAASKSAHEQLTATLGSATTSPAATLAAATKFMKILDPGSVVRESELGMALAASGVIDRAMNYISTLQSGQKLTATQAADFKKISGQMFQAAQRVQQAIDKDYQGKAKAYGLRPEMVTQDLGQNANVVSWGDLK
jgi:hypothetical protein